MKIYRVSYASMTARYGPSFIEAESEFQAKQKFSGNAFTSGEMAYCITATEVTPREMMLALQNRGEQ